MDGIVEVPGVSRRIRVFAFTVTVAACCAADSAVAAKVYRCGNVFQDRPCDAAQPADVRPGDQVTPPAPTKAVARADADQRPVTTPASGHATETGVKVQRIVASPR